MASPGFTAVGLGECFIDYKSTILVQQMQSAFHPRAQRNAFRRHDVRQQSRSFARWNQVFRRGHNSTDVAEFVGDDSAS